MLSTYYVIGIVLRLGTKKQMRYRLLHIYSLTISVLQYLIQLSPKYQSI